MVADPGSDEIIGSLGGGHHQCQHLLLTTVETEAQKGWWTGRSHIYHFAKLGLESGVLTSTPIHSFLKCSNQTLNVCFQLLSRVWLFMTPMDCSTPGFILPHYFPEFAQIYVRWVMLSNRLTLCSPLFFFSSIFPSIGGFSNESALHIRWPKYWSFSFRISPSNEYSGLIFFRIDWFDFVVLQETQKFSLAPQFESINSLALSFLF